MKKVKKIIAVIAIAMMIMPLVLSTSVQALTLGIENLRESGYAYQENSKDIFKIVTRGVPDKYIDTYYCLKPTQGFGTSGAITDVEYTTSFNLREPSKITPSIYRDQLPLSDTDYNAMLWLLDNMYDPKTSTAEERTALLTAAGINEQDYSENAMTDDEINDDIEVIQQLALWYITMTDLEYHKEYINAYISQYGVATGYESISDRDGGFGVEKRSTNLTKLYDYLRTNALANANLYGTGEIRGGLALLTIENLVTSAQISGTNVMAGPFKITTQGSVAYTLTAAVTDGTNPISNYGVYTKSGSNYTQIPIVTDLATTIKSLANTEFYIGIPTVSAPTNINVNIGGGYSDRSLTYWSVDQLSVATEQPIVQIEKILVPLSRNFSFTVDQRVFDLALRKFITAVNDVELTGVEKREPTPEKSTDTSKDIEYKFPDPIDPKSANPVIVKNGDVVTYTIRVYNEGEIDGYAKEIKDDIPDGLEFLPTHPTNVKYGWQSNGTGSVYTNYWAKENDAQRLIDEGQTGLMHAFDWVTEDYDDVDYRDVQIAFKVTAPNTHKELIKNIAEIKEDTDEDGNPITDKDSTPDNNVSGEDDIDVEYIKLQYFDLALRKFITEVNRNGQNLNIGSRVPVPKASTETTRDIFYEHDKTPVVVTYGDIVTYTIRVYNEGEIDGYAEEIIDTIPAGLVFLPDNDINIKYGWQERDAGNGRTEVYTEYWSEAEASTRTENTDALIKARDISKTLPEGLDYRDVQIAFRFEYRITLADKNTDKKIINIAEISKDKNEHDIPDKDSIPGNGDGGYDFTDYTDNDQYDNEDDTDFEQLKTLYFDLALKKYVSKAIVTEDGKTTVTNTGHTGDENPEPPAKVEINKKKLDKTTVKFVFTIKITNEGQIAGYANEIKDHIPAGLKFVAEDEINKQNGWIALDDGTVVTRALENTLLQPGESATIEIVLTWINGKDNLGLKTNVAEISEDENDTKTPDIDSIPDNLKPDRPYEDDEDDAPVILTISQGTEQVVYVVLPTMVMAILGVGIYLIKSKVLMV